MLECLQQCRATVGVAWDTRAGGGTSVMVERSISAQQVVTTWPPILDAVMAPLVLARQQSLVEWLRTANMYESRQMRSVCCDGFSCCFVSNQFVSLSSDCNVETNNDHANGSGSGSAAAPPPIAAGSASGRSRSVTAPPTTCATAALQEQSVCEIFPMFIRSMSWQNHHF